MQINRRQALQNMSIGGMSLAMSSCLRSIQASDAGDPLPKRFVFVVKSSGIDKYNLVPPGLDNHFVSPAEGTKLGNRGRLEGPLVDVSLAEHELPEKLAGTTGCFHRRSSQLLCSKPS